MKQLPVPKPHELGTLVTCHNYVRHQKGAGHASGILQSAPNHLTKDCQKVKLIQRRHCMRLTLVGVSSMRNLRALAGSMLPAPAFPLCLPLVFDDETLQQVEWDNTPWRGR